MNCVFDTARKKAPRTRGRLAALSLLSSLVLLAGLPARAQGDFDPTIQTPELLLDEARTVYLGNLARRDNGLPPLRWNLQLTRAARWYSWDSTERRPDGFCGHQDTNGNWPNHRARAFGYLGMAGAENAFCGYVTPKQAISGWMSSPGHRANLLDPNSREVGLGYYRRTGDGRGYVTQDFGADPAYPPVVIENEAITTTSPMVNLYIYNRSEGAGFAGTGMATEMSVSNTPCFEGAAWEPYAANKSWVLESGQGWRSVYVKTRDIFGRTMTVSDTIYLGDEVPLDELGDAQLSTTHPTVTLHCVNGAGLPMVQFSLGWLADDTFPTFDRLWGNGEHVNDPLAWGGTAYRLYAGDGESSAWVWDTTFIKDRPFVAYFRLKVSDNTSTQEVARVTVEGGGTEYGPLRLRGVDFAAPGRYQEFAVNFTFNNQPGHPFLIFRFWRSGNTDVFVDAVSIFTTPQPVSATMAWAVPGGNYRGQGVWARYTDGARFSDIVAASTMPAKLSVAPTAITFMAVRGGDPPPPATVRVTQECGLAEWQAGADVPWLSVERNGDAVLVSATPTGFGSGTYTGTVTISADGAPPASVPVRLLVLDAVHVAYIPLAQR